MKKNVLIKGILVLIVIALLSIGFVGCAPVIPTTGTVIITIQGSYTFYNYNIYLDNWLSWIGTTWGGTFTATNITPGWHTFYADDNVFYWYWDSGTVYVTAGQTSYLTLYPW